MRGGIVIDRIPYSEDFDFVSESMWSKLPVIDACLLNQRMEQAYMSDQPVNFGVISCMPNLELTSTGPRDLTYSYGPYGLKSAVDYKASELATWKSCVSFAFSIDVNLTCLVADTEARVKSDGLLFPSTKTAVSRVADKVVNRVSKVFPGNVLKRSSVFPVSDPIYRRYFRRTFLEIYNEIVLNDPLNNPRVTSRLSTMLELGLDYDFAYERSLRDLALQDAEYAMEGAWIAYRSGWTGLLIIDNYPLSAAKRTSRLAGMPIIFPVKYDKF